MTESRTYAEELQAVINEGCSKIPSSIPNPNHLQYWIAVEENEEYTKLINIENGKSKIISRKYNKSLNLSCMVATKDDGIVVHVYEPTPLSFALTEYFYRGFVAVTFVASQTHLYDGVKVLFTDNYLNLHELIISEYHYKTLSINKINYYKIGFQLTSGYNSIAITEQLLGRVTPDDMTIISKQELRNLTAAVPEKVSVERLPKDTLAKFRHLKCVNERGFEKLDYAIQLERIYEELTELMNEYHYLRVERKK